VPDVDFAAWVGDFDAFADAGAGPLDVAVFLAALGPDVARPDVFEPVLLEPGDDAGGLDGEAEVVDRPFAREAAAADFDEERLLGDGVSELDVGWEALTTDTSVAEDTFAEGAIDTTPTVVVTTPAVVRLEVVIAARAAMAPEPLTEVAEVDAEILEVALDVVDRITGATMAVTTVAVVRRVPDPNPGPAIEVAFPTAATSDVDDTADELKTAPEDWIKSAADEAPAPAALNPDETGRLPDNWEGAVTDEDGVLSPAEVLGHVDTEPVIP